MRKFLVVVDETPECMTALYFAAHRARSTGGQVKILYVIEDDEAQLWLTVGAKMKAQARREAERRIADLAYEVNERAGVLPEFLIREGDTRGEILSAIEEDASIRILVLGAATGNDGPGPLVTALAGSMAGKMTIPVTVVPGSISLDHIKEIA